MSHIMSSNLSAPTELFPVALVSKSVEVFPSDVGSVIMTYYRQPSSRYMASNGGLFVQGECDYSSSPRYAVFSEVQMEYYVNNPVNSRDFDLPERFKGRCYKSEICKMIGVRLRDASLSQYGQTQVNYRLIRTFRQLRG